MTNTKYDAVVVGSGPNGLSAAIVLRQAGLSVLLIEGKPTIGGGLRSASLTLPGYIHDVCSAIHPFAVFSPLFNSLPLQKHGLEFLYSPLALAHPFDDGSAAELEHDIHQTAMSLGADTRSYEHLMQNTMKNWPAVSNSIAHPFAFPKHLIPLARFGSKGIFSARRLIERNFKGMQARGMLAGVAAHGVQPLTNWITGAITLIFLCLGHDKGWPFPKGGSQQLANALASYFLSLGGRIETDWMVESLDELPNASAYLLDITPKQLLKIGGSRLSAWNRRQMKNFKYGSGVFKVDWALDGPIPFKSDACKKAATVHLGNSFEEIMKCEQEVSLGKIPEYPFVLLAQQSLFDPTRAPQDRQVAWAYCHVPANSGVDMTERIEKQVERFAPGFRDRILSKHVFDAVEMESYNPNYVGGDIGGGIQNWKQLITRPALRFPPYRTSAQGVYLCSSSTPPGGGVHGLCGFNAAKQALKDIFGQR
ncbi:MAG: FAD-dependent oxidoreductase [Bacteroidetes bacterium]|nr:MAG: FAD-dependent oxidoreductase [Bacteroidota bacterium]